MADAEPTIDKVRNDISALEREIDWLEEQEYDRLRQAGGTGDPGASSALKKAIGDIHDRKVTARRTLASLKLELRTRLVPGAKPAN